MADDRGELARMLWVLRVLSTKVVKVLPAWLWCIGRHVVTLSDGSAVVERAVL
jgi:hypothetical protein